MVYKKRLFSNQLRKNVTNYQQLSNQVCENSSQRKRLGVVGELVFRLPITEAQ
jgi:hypothetical protein